MRKAIAEIRKRRIREALGGGAGSRVAEV